jgi:hypothetical protein
MVGQPMPAAQLNWKEIFDFPKGRRRQTALAGKSFYWFSRSGQAGGLIWQSFLGKARLVPRITRSLHGWLQVGSKGEEL